MLFIVIIIAVINKSIHRNTLDVSLEVIVSKQKKRANWLAS